MTDGEEEMTREDVPDEVVWGEDSTQMENCIRDGYRAFVNGKEPGDNPYHRRPGESFSGFKKRKLKLWAGGWKLAAVREGDSDLGEVTAEYDIHSWLPRSPYKAIYDRLGSPVVYDDVNAEYVYQSTGGEPHDNRHDALDEAVIDARDSSLPSFGTDPGENVKQAVRKVSVRERLRPPLLSGEYDD